MKKQLALIIIIACCISLAAVGVYILYAAIEQKPSSYKGPWWWPFVLGTGFLAVGLGQLFDILKKLGIFKKARRQ
ncbi:MAG: hypothetical protein WCT19_01255 [Candidatus Paceibacterota bacterium]|jgi:hypothetical protein